MNGAIIFGLACLAAAGFMALCWRPPIVLGDRARRWVIALLGPGPLSGRELRRRLVAEGLAGSGPTDLAAFYAMLAGMEDAGQLYHTVAWRQVRGMEIRVFVYHLCDRSEVPSP